MFSLLAKSLCFLFTILCIQLVYLDVLLLFIYMLFFIIYCLSIISSCFHWPPYDSKNIFSLALQLESAPYVPSLWNIGCYSAAGVCQHGVASSSRSILYFQLIGKNRHLWPSLTDENDSLLSWLRRSPIYFVCKCLFFRQSMCKVTNVTNFSPDDSAGLLVAIWWNFCYDIPLKFFVDSWTDIEEKIV